MIDAISNDRLKPPLDNIKKFRLSNGLSLLVKEDHTIPLVAIFVWVKVGSLNEPDELAGICHFLEHMLFKGTRKRNVGDLAREIKGAGGYLNAFTSYDETCYFIVLPSMFLDLGLESQADALLYSTFDPQELEKETRVILEEIKTRDDHPESIIWEKLMETAFVTHRYRRPVIGYESTTAHMTREDLVDFYKDYYQPDNTLLVVTGDVESETFLPLAEQYFGQHRGTHKPMNTSPAEPPQKQFRFHRFQGDISQVYLNLGFHMPVFLNDEAIILEVIAGLLSDGKSSRLFQQLREEKSLVSSISAGSLAGLEPGLFIVTASLNGQKILETYGAIFTELERLKHEPVQKSEFERIKINIEKAFYHDMETVEGISRKLAEFEHLQDYVYIDSYIDKLKSVNSDDVQRVAEKYFTVEKCTSVLYQPRDGNTSSDLTLEIVKETIERACASAEKEYRIKQPVSRQIARSVDYDVIGIAENVDLVYRNRRSVPLVAMGAFVFGGIRNETVNNNGITSLTQKMLMKGTTNRDFKTLAMEIESIGGNISPIIGKDVTGLFMTILAQSFETGMDIFGDICFNGIFEEHHIAKEKEIILAQIKQEKDNLMRLCIQNLYQTLFSNHAYGLRLLGTEKAVLNLTREDLTEWYKQFFVDNKILLSVVGDAPRDVVLHSINHYFAGNHRNNVTHTNTPVAPLEGIKSITETREKRQTSLAIGFQCPGIKHADYFPISVMEEILSGMGGRLFINLRDRDYLGYIVHSYFDASYDMSTFWIYLGIPPEREQEALEKTFVELNEIKNNPVPENEIRDAKAAIIGNRLIDLQHNSALVLEYAKREILEQRHIHEGEFAALIEAVTREDIMRVANAYFDLGKYAISIIKPHDIEREQ